MSKKNYIQFAFTRKACTAGEKCCFSALETKRTGNTRTNWSVSLVDSEIQFASVEFNLDQ